MREQDEFIFEEAYTAHEARVLHSLRAIESEDPWWLEAAQVKTQYKLRTLYTNPPTRDIYPQLNSYSSVQDRYDNLVFNLMTEYYLKDRLDIQQHDLQPLILLALSALPQSEEVIVPKAEVILHKSSEETYEEIRGLNRGQYPYKLSDSTILHLTALRSLGEWYVQNHIIKGVSLALNSIVDDLPKQARILTSMTLMDMGDVVLNGFETHYDILARLLALHSATTGVQYASWKRIAEVANDPRTNKSLLGMLHTANGVLADFLTTGDIKLAASFLDGDESAPVVTREGLEFLVSKQHSLHKDLQGSRWFPTPTPERVFEQRRCPISYRHMTLRAIDPLEYPLGPGASTSRFIEIMQLAEQRAPSLFSVQQSDERTWQVLGKTHPIEVMNQQIAVVLQKIPRRC